MRKGKIVLNWTIWILKGCATHVKSWWLLLGFFYFFFKDEYSHIQPKYTEVSYHQRYKQEFIPTCLSLDPYLIETKKCCFIQSTFTAYTKSYPWFSHSKKQLRGCISSHKILYKWQMWIGWNGIVFVSTKLGTRIPLIYVEERCLT